MLSLPTTILIGVMAVLAIVCVYFWLVRKRDVSGANSGPEQK